MAESAGREDKARRQRLAIAWGAGVFLGVGIGGAIGLAMDAWLVGLGLAVAIAVVVAGAYLMAGYSTAERRAERIVARQDLLDDDADDDGTY